MSHERKKKYLLCIVYEWSRGMQVNVWSKQMGTVIRSWVRHLVCVLDLFCILVWVKNLWDFVIVVITLKWKAKWITIYWLVIFIKKLWLCISILCNSLSAGDEHVLWQCLGLLEEGLSHSPSNAQLKLLLLLLYCRLGAFEPVVDLYSSLDAKHIQHDTIGWDYYLHTVWNSDWITSLIHFVFTFHSQILTDSLCRVLGPICCCFSVL